MIKEVSISVLTVIALVFSSAQHNVLFLLYFVSDCLILFTDFSGYIIYNMTLSLVWFRNNIEPIRA